MCRVYVTAQLILSRSIRRQRNELVNESNTRHQICERPDRLRPFFNYVSSMWLMHTAWWTPANVCVRRRSERTNNDVKDYSTVAWTLSHVAWSLDPLSAAATSLDWRAVHPDAGAAVVGRKAAHRRRRQHQDNNRKQDAPWDDWGLASHDIQP